MIELRFRDRHISSGYFSPFQQQQSSCRLWVSVQLYWQWYNHKINCVFSKSCLCHIAKPTVCFQQPLQNTRLVSNGQSIKEKEALHWNADVDGRNLDVPGFGISLWTVWTQRNMMSMKIFHIWYSPLVCLRSALCRIRQSFTVYKDKWLKVKPTFTLKKRKQLTIMWEDISVF